MIFTDSNAIIDLLDTKDGAPQGDWAIDIYERAVGVDSLICNLIVIAEVAAGFDEPINLLADLAKLEIDVLDLSVEAAFQASTAFREYRRRGGPRSTMLPDFLIAAHA